MEKNYDSIQQAIEVLENHNKITRQHAEIQPNDYVNTLTSFEKDNYIFVSDSFFYFARKLTSIECFRLMGLLN